MPSALVSLRHLTRRFTTGDETFTALDDVNLDIDAGEFVAIVGKSGSGKSTLLNLMAGIERPTSGSIHVGGVSLGERSEGALAAWRGRNIGVVFQFFQLLPTLTIVENVMLPMEFCQTQTPRAARSRALALLSQVGIVEHANKLPTQLSGGQQQRAAIARALANDPPVIVADEPTGNLDTHTTHAVLTLLRAQRDAGKTVLMVTHERDLGDVADRTIALADGRIVFDRRAGATVVAEVSHV